jgi:hypothetical protein
MLIANGGAVITTLLGVLALLFPSSVARVLGVEARNPLGSSELRATYGGFFIGLGVGCWLAQSSVVFGGAWCTAGCIRLLTICFERSLSSENVVGAAVELAIGFAMLSAIYSFG